MKYDDVKSRDVKNHDKVILSIYLKNNIISTQIGIGHLIKLLIIFYSTLPILTLYFSLMSNSFKNRFFVANYVMTLTKHHSRSH